MVVGLTQHQHPAHHRYPVWWTGDGVVLEASVQSMVDSGVYDLKPYVHSDCGGDYRPDVGGDLLRWTEHCTFGTVFRYHGAEHQPWSYDQHTEDVIRQYLNLRYKMIPTLIAAGQQATLTGFPIVVRCDLFWPQFQEATSNLQYLHLNDTLVAPIWDSTNNVTSVSVWIPPGSVGRRLVFCNPTHQSINRSIIAARGRMPGRGQACRARRP
jgi:alpha-glucosidase (family GH31 glycosyl hydrolase)